MNLNVQEQSERLVQGLQQQISDRQRMLVIGCGTTPIVLVKDWYTPIEVAALVQRDAYTIREWCRGQRINARNRSVGRGGKLEWEISAEEIIRYSNHGLLPASGKKAKVTL